MHFSNRFRLGFRELPSSSPSKQCWNEQTLLGQVKCTGVRKVQHCLGARGKGGKIKAGRVNCPKIFDLHSGSNNILLCKCKEITNSCR